MPRTGEQMHFSISFCGFLHSFAVFRRDETIVRAVEEQDRDCIFIQALDRPHPAEGITEPDPDAHGRQIEQETRSMHFRCLGLQYRNNIPEPAVRHNKIDRRLFFQHRDGSGGTEGFAVDTKEGSIGIALPAVML